MHDDKTDFDEHFVSAGHANLEFSIFNFEHLTSSPA